MKKTSEPETIKFVKKDDKWGVFMKSGNFEIEDEDFDLFYKLYKDLGYNIEIIS